MKKAFFLFIVTFFCITINAQTESPEGELAEMDSIAKKKFVYHYNFGIDKYDHQDYQGAIEEYNKALEVDTSDSDVYNNRGNAKGKLGMHKEALADFNKAIILNPEHKLAHGNKAFAKYNLMDYKGALEDYNKALEISPDNEEFNNNRGDVKYSLGDIDGAIVDYTKAIDLDPNLIFTLVSRGIAKYDKKDFDGAKEDFEKAIQLEEKYAEAYFYLGNVLFRLEDKGEACASWGKAGELGFDDAFTQIKNNCK